LPFSRLKSVVQKVIFPKDRINSLDAMGERQAPNRPMTFHVYENWTAEGHKGTGSPKRLLVLQLRKGCSSDSPQGNIRGCKRCSP
jgi:hypothetical protein